MCGIFGWALGDKSRQNRQLLVQLTDRLSHRGPDGAGYFLTDARDSNFQIGLGHRRLSIIDIEGGAQPMWNHERSLAVIFNGEIYNYIELRNELKTLGHCFSTNSDTEVLLEAYKHWGLRALARFRGMFAFALWDVANQQLILARDPFGKKPVFYVDRPGKFLFSSEIEPLTHFPSSELSLDPQAFEHYLLNRYVPGPLTFFKEIKKLQPGCLAIWEHGRLRIERYFTPPFASTVPDITRFDEAVELFSAGFDEAVRIRMRSDAPYGAYLSGGVDSSAVVGAMVRHSGAPVRTFSVGFADSAYSELEHARAVAEQFGTDHHELIVEHKPFFEHLRAATVHRGAPVTEASDVPIFMLSKMASTTVKMVLTGEGSDELLGGYPKHRAELWISRYHMIMPNLLHTLIVGPAARSLPYGMRRLKILANAAGERNLANRMRIWFGGTSIEERDALLGRRGPSNPPDAYPFSASIGSNVRRTLFFDQTSWLPDNLLERGDRMMMAGSIEGRMPFMDSALASIVARLPDRFLIGGRGGKAVLRAAVSRTLPMAILRRRKVGFRVPFDEWFRGPHSDLIRRMLTSESSTILRLCDPKRVLSLVDNHIAGRQNNERILWSLLNFELFLEVFRPSGIEDLLIRADQNTAHSSH